MARAAMAVIGLILLGLAVPGLLSGVGRVLDERRLEQDGLLVTGVVIELAEAGGALVLPGSKLAGAPRGDSRMARFSYPLGDGRRGEGQGSAALIPLARVGGPVPVLVDPARPRLYVIRGAWRRDARMLAVMALCGAVGVGLIVMALPGRRRG